MGVMFDRVVAFLTWPWRWLRWRAYQKRLIKNNDDTVDVKLTTEDTQ